MSDIEENIEEKEVLISGNNGKEEVDGTSTEIRLDIDKKFDKEFSSTYLARLFAMANNVGNIFYKEGLHQGETLFISYLLERGSLKSMLDRNPSSEKLKNLVLDNQNRMNMIVNSILQGEINRINMTK